MKWNIFKALKWSLHEIDETDFDNLIAFISFKPEDDPNTRIINGKTYHRASKPPSWL